MATQSSILAWRIPWAAWRATAHGTAESARLKRLSMHAFIYFLGRGLHCCSSLSPAAVHEPLIAVASLVSGRGL